MLSIFAPPVSSVYHPLKSYPVLVAFGRLPFVPAYVSPYVTTCVASSEFTPSIVAFGAFNVTVYFSASQFAVYVKAPVVPFVTCTLVSASFPFAPVQPLNV